MSQTPMQFLGHPRGLYTLFFTELWERFSFYGMRAILVLFMVAAVEGGNPGMALDVATATAIYGLYTAGVYLLSLPGGWIADRLIGQQQAVWYGGLIIALGHFSMAVPSDASFFFGLVLIVVGTGLLKPSVSTIVGELYPEGGSRRDAGFSIFYMGINIGAFLGPLICGWLGETINWHYGFAAAGFGMLAGLVQYRMHLPWLGDAGRHPTRDLSNPNDRELLRKEWTWTLVAVAALGTVVVAALTGVFTIVPTALAAYTTYFIVAVAVIYFTVIIVLGGLDLQQRKRVGGLAALFLFSAIFWSGFEQAGSSLNIFAEQFTDRVILGWEMPASWLQSVNPIFIILMAPAFAAFWVWLGRRNLDPSIPVKFALGLVFLGIGFAVMAFASMLVVQSGPVLPTWLILTYMFHTMGELCLSPVGLSAVTKLSPRKYLGQMMGLWFLSISLGNLIAGLVAGRFDPGSLPQMPGLFLTIVAVTVGAGLLLLLISPLMKRLFHGVR